MNSPNSEIEQLKIYVVNLARSPDRRAKMERRLNELNLSFEFFDGVDGSLLSSEEIASVYKPLAAFNRLGRELHPNEMACSWSHIKIYEQMVQGGIQESLILEDDVDLSDELPQVLASRKEWLPTGWRVVNFAHDMAEPIPVQKFTIPGLECLSLCRFNSLVGRTGAYLINIEAAKSMLGAAYPIRMPPDDLVGDAAFVGATVYGLVPRVAIWDDEFTSTIWTDKSREQFAKECRNTWKGILSRLYRRLSRLVG